MNIVICDDDKCFVETLYQNIFEILMQYDYDDSGFQIYKYQFSTNFNVSLLS